jgi:hypothetical protein
MAPKARKTTTIVTTTTTVVEHVGGKRGKKDDGDEKKVLKKPSIKYLRCEGIIAKGRQCIRQAKYGAFCWQHKDEMDDEGELGDGDGDDESDMPTESSEPETPEPKVGHTGMTQEMENMGC